MSLTIAMWSGPRNISTAMMRAWENRPDCEVWDEPLYAAYLRDSGMVHPMQAEILADNENDWRKVIARCAAAAPNSSAIFYQKQMTHHLLAAYLRADCTRDWLAQVQHCFLLRHPRDVLMSYSQKRSDATLGDIGIIEQREIFNTVNSLQGQAPLIIDSADFLSNPEAYLRAICNHFAIAFYPAMLSWPSGKRDSDGVWGDHWYANVWESTGFLRTAQAAATLPKWLDGSLDGSLPKSPDGSPDGSPDRSLPKSPDGSLDRSLKSVLHAALPVYEELHAHRLRL